MDMENIGYYIFCLVAIIVAIFIVKRVASCLIKSVLFAAILAVLALVYYFCIR